MRWPVLVQGRVGIPLMLEVQFPPSPPPRLCVRDWSLMTKEGAIKWEKHGSETPPPPPTNTLSQDVVKLFVPPLPFFSKR